MVITKEQFDAKLVTNPYFAGRWDYFSVVIDLINKLKPTSILEIGTNDFPLCSTSDTIDIKGNPTYKQDITQTPWKLNKKYDLAIALQVWEHLQGNQQKCFLELGRVAKSAILSFPYKWNCPGDIHHNIDEEVIERWTWNIKPTQTWIVGDEVKRIIYYW